MSFSPGPALELAYSQRMSNQGGLISEGNVESNSSGTSLSPKATNPLVRSSHRESQTPTTAAGATAAAPLRSRVRCKPLPRKGHKKSRKGCLTCKSRRVKCTETFPECGPCVRLSLPCTWPDNNTLMEDEGRTHAEEAVPVATEAVPNRVYTTTTSWQGPQGQGQGQQQQQLQRRPSPVESTPLRSTRGVLAMEDLHLFHHFLFFAYPPLPSEGSSIWRNVSAMSHKVSDDPFPRYLQCPPASTFLLLICRRYIYTHMLSLEPTLTTERVHVVRISGSRHSRPCRLPSIMVR